MSHLRPVPSDPDALRAWLAEHGGPDAAAAGADLGADLAADPRFVQFVEFVNDAIAVPPAPVEPAALTVTVALRDTEPPVWRRLGVPGDLRLDRFHDVLQVAMGWTDSHLHHFTLSDDPGASYFVTDPDVDEGDDGTPEHEVRLDQVLRTVGDRLLYAYDFGDGWEHVVRLESVAALEDDARPRCLAGEQACPPEDCGGIPGYEQLVDWHRAGRTEAALPDGFDSVEHAESWLGNDWDPARFDAAEADLLLAAEHEAELRLQALHPDLAVLLQQTPAEDVLGPWLGRLPGRSPEAGEHAAGTRHWQVLLEQLGNFVPLTAAGWLPPAVVSRVDEALGRPVPYGKGTREEHTAPVRELREAAQRVGLYRKRKGVLEVTTRGLRAHTPDSCWRLVGERLPVGRADAEREAGWFALLAIAGGLSLDELRQPVAQLLAARGWRERTGDPIGEWAAFHLYRETLVALLGPAFWDDRPGSALPAWARVLAADVVTGGR